uniref:Uncharacterized protein n=1 Tax=Avena sativa TaxID=4498 RepID=A0ACD5YD28_AVESA
MIGRQPNFECFIRALSPKKLLTAIQPANCGATGSCCDSEGSCCEYCGRFVEGSPTEVVLLVPSAFTKVTGEAHWEILLRARAIETQCYVIAAAQAGKHNEKRESYGDSIIIDPWGVVIARLPDRLSTGFAVADIDLSKVEAVRTKMPISEQRKFDSILKSSPL